MNIDNLREYINNLNPEQQSAATYGEGGVLVLAAAGSGKTSTLTCRIAYLVGEKNVPAHNILAVTFTNKASKEMIARLQKMGMDTKNLWIGTFHGICNKILRYHALEAGIKKNFYIMDQQEQLSFLKRICRANGYDPKDININDIQHKINGYKEVGWRSNQLRVGSQERNIYELYEQGCLKDNCLDFAELMLGCYELFQNNPTIADAYAEKFQHILVDEFQDTSELQYKWLKLLAEKNKNIFAVGDDDQCFVAGTPILMADGSAKNIELIEKGDLVLSRTSSGAVEGKVINTHTSIKCDLIKLTFDNELEIVCTEEHTIFARDPNNIRKNKNQEIRMILGKNSSLNYKHNPNGKFTENNKNGYHSCEADIFVESNNAKPIMEIYADNWQDIELYANNILNWNKIPKVYLAQLGQDTLEFLQASQLEVGFEVYQADGSLVKIRSIERIKEEKQVYDIDIEHFHNYCANGVMVHNSIYGFRGAKPENLNYLLRDFNAATIKIEKNYRSDAYILEAANAIISNNTNRQGKNLVPTKPSKQMLGLYTAFNDEQESGYIASEIKRLRRSGIPYRNMAILYRTNGQSRSLEKALTSMAIPYLIYGGFRFFDRQEVKHAMAYLRLANNPHDNMAFLRVANLPVRAIGDAALKKLEVTAKELNCSLYSAANGSEGKTLKKYEPFLEVIDNLVNYCKGKRIADQVRLVIVNSGLEAMYEKDQKEGEERLDNLYELISAAEVFMAENPKADIDEFLAFSTLETNVESNKRDENADAIKMMTVHASKGLEFDVVFISGLEETLFPHANAIKEPSLIEEERRLMYVAITRAKELLYLTNCEERLLHGQRNRFVRSRFIKEIPSKLILKLN
jgi:superfamily I DNA/RNA helicase